MSELIKRFKSEYLHTKKSLGQHFLTNAHFIAEIANTAELNGDVAVEIGPGCGVLTEALAKHTDKLTAIELDDNAVQFLKANKEDCFPNLNIIHADVLTVDIGGLYDEQITIIGNLPYNLSVRIVQHCTDSISNIKKMIFMFQKEVAARIVATPGSKDYSSLSVYCNYHYEISKVRDISGGNFWPNANVYSTVLVFTPKKDFPLTVAAEKAFFEFIREAFQQKRKTLKNNLKRYDKLASILFEMEISASVRAEELSLEQFLQIYSALMD